MREYDDTLLFTQTIRERLDAEAAMDSEIGVTTASWFAVKVLNRGKGDVVIERNYNPEKTGMLAIPDPSPCQAAWAVAVAKILNHEIDHDGCWIVGLTHPPGFGEFLKIQPRFEWRRTIKLWVDNDGDPQFTSDCIDPWRLVVEQNPDHFINQSEKAWQHWKRLMRDVLEPTEDELRPMAKLRDGRRS